MRSKRSKLQAFSSMILFSVFVLFPDHRIFAADWSAGPLLHDYPLTLSEGHRTEAVSPFFYSEQRESVHTWAIPPLFSHTQDPDTESEEYDFLYPLLTYDRFGAEYRFQIFQLFSFAGGRTQSETNVSRFTLFPLYFQQRSAIPEKNYTAVIPFYGHLKNRLFRDEVGRAEW